MSSLEQLGWTPFFENQIDPITDSGLDPVRVTEEQRGSFSVMNTTDTFSAELIRR